MATLPETLMVSTANAVANDSQAAEPQGDSEGAVLLSLPAAPTSQQAPRKEEPVRRPSPVLAAAYRAAAAILPTIVVLGLLLIVWQFACGAPGSSLPAPSKIWADSHDVILHPLKGVTFNGLKPSVDGGDVGIAVHILTSLRRVAIGFGLAAVAGIGLGVLIGQSRLAYRALDPLFQVLRTVPPLAWLPISLAVFQKAQPSSIFLIFITAIWPVILNTAAGVQAIPPTYRNVAKVLALNPVQYFTKIMLPATVPHMFTGLRIGVGMSWLAIVAAEMVQGGTGIGFFIWDSYNSSLLSDTIVALVWIGLVGFALDRIVGAIGRRVARQA
jgi:nitrate/nitrite transport system permease protein